MSFSLGLKSDEDDSSSSEDESNLILFAFSSSNATLFFVSIIIPMRFSLIFSRNDAIFSSFESTSLDPFVGGIGGTIILERGVLDCCIKEMPRVSSQKRPVGAARFARLNNTRCMLLSETPKAQMFDSMVTQAEVEARMNTMQIDWKWRTDKNNIPIFQKWVNSLSQELTDDIYPRLTQEITKTGIKDELRTFNPNTILALRILAEDKPYRSLIAPCDWIRQGIEKFVFWENEKKAIFRDNKEHLLVNRNTWNTLCNSDLMTDEIFRDLESGTIHEDDSFYVNMECLIRLHPRIPIPLIQVY